MVPSIRNTFLGLAAIASFAWAGGVVNAATLQPIIAEAPTGVETPLTVRVIDADETPNVATFNLRVYFNENQVDVTAPITETVLVTNDEGQPGGIVTDLGVVKEAVGDYALAGYTHYIQYIATAGNQPDSTFTLGPDGGLFELTFKSAATYSGALSFAVLPGEPNTGGYYTDSDGSDFDTDFPNNNNPIYSLPSVSGISPSIHVIGDTVPFDVQVLGANFYGGPAPAPVSQIKWNDTPVATTFVSGSELTANIDATTLANFDTVAAVDEIDVVVDNISPNGASSPAHKFYIVSTDEIWVDKDWTGSNLGDEVDVHKFFGYNAFASIQEGVDAASEDTGVVNVLASTDNYAENVVISNPGIELVAAEGAVLTGPDTAANTSRLIQVDVDGVEISGLDFDMNAHAGVGIFADGRANLVVEGCSFDLTSDVTKAAGTITGTWGPKGVFFNGTAYDASQVTLTSNTFKCDNYFKDACTPGVEDFRFSYAMHVDRATATIDGNNSSGAYRDLALRFSAGTVTNNNFAMNMNLSQAAGPIAVTGNTISNIAGRNIQHEEAALTIQANNQGNEINIEGNHFINTGRGIWSGGSKDIIVKGNDFTPAAVVNNEAIDALCGPGTEPIDKYAHIIVDSYNITSAASGTPDIGIEVTGNTFNGSAGVSEGVAVELRQKQDGNFNGLIFGTLGEENIFAGNLTEYVHLAALFTDDVNFENNSFDGTLGSAITVAQGYAIEDMIFHKIDDSNLGFVRVNDGDVFVTANGGTIQAAVNAATGGTVDPDVPGDVVHVANGLYPESNILVAKRVSVVGESQDGVVVVPAGEDSQESNLFAGTYQHGFIIANDKVEISQLTIDGQGNTALTALKNNYRAGITTDYNSGDYSGAIISYVTLKNILRSAVVFKTAVHSTMVNTVQNSDLLNVEDYYAIQAFNSDTNVFGNEIKGSRGLLANYSAAEFAPVVDVKGTTISETSKSGLYLVGAGDGSIVGGPLATDGNFFDYVDGSTGYSYPLSISYQIGQVTVQNNRFSVDSNDTAIRMFNNNDSAKPVRVIDNVFTSVNSETDDNGQGAAIFMTDNGFYFGGDGDDGHSYATIEGNSIDGFVNGIEMRRDGDNEAIHFIEATIGGSEAGKSNEITNCETGIMVWDEYDSEDGYRSLATIVGNDATISTNTVGINVDGGYAVITGNKIVANEIGVLVEDAGKAQIGGSDEGDANVMIANAKHFSFESFESGIATVNDFDAFDRIPSELESIINANALKGKVYLTESMMVPGSTIVQESGYINVRSTINASVAVAEAEVNTANVLPDTYIENVILDKEVLVNGAGIDQAIISAPIDGINNAAVRCATVDGAIIQGFTITREGNNEAEWNNPGLASAGAAVQGGAGNFTVRNNKFTGNRTGIDINNSQGNVIENNIIDYNRTGMILRNGCPNNTITGNFITNNWTKGVLWLKTELVANSAGTAFLNNQISGNWYGDVQNRATDGGYKQFALNWFGHSGPITVSAVNVSEPGYAELIPAAYKAGGATNPGGGINITGEGLLMTDATPYLNAGDQDAGALGFQADHSSLNVMVDAGQEGPVGRIAEGVQRLVDGDLIGAARLVNVWPGVYTEENSTLVQPARVLGVGATRADVIVQPVTAGSGNGLIIGSDDVTIENLTVQGYDIAISRVDTYHRTKLVNLAVTNSGSWSSPKGGAVTLAESAGQSTGNVVSGCEFTACTYAGLQLLGGQTDVVNHNTFTNMDYLGVFAIVSTVSSPVVNIDGNEFTKVPAAVRLYGTDDSSVVNNNDFHLGMGETNKVTLGVQIESGNASITDNRFDSNGTETVGNSAYGLGGGNIGISIWNSYSIIISGSTISGNTFTSTAPTRTATAISLVGNRVGDLAGSSGNEAVNGTFALITGNNISNYKYGVRADNSVGENQAVFFFFGLFSEEGQENIISGCEIGVKIDGDDATGFLVNNSGIGIHDNNVGVEVSRGHALVSENSLYNNEIGINVVGTGEASILDNDFTGTTLETAVTDLNIDVEGEVDIVDNFFAANSNIASRYIVNTSTQEFFVGQNYFAETVTYGKDLNVADEADRAKLWAIENKLTHELDNLSYGLLRVQPGYVFATHKKSVPNGIIGRAIVAADEGDTVHVQESPVGSPYFENPTVSKNITLVSADGPHKAEIATGGSVGLFVPLDDSDGQTVIDGFKVTGSASIGLWLNGLNQGSNTTFELKNLLFENLPTAEGNIALAVSSVNLHAGIPAPPAQNDGINAAPVPLEFGGGSIENIEITGCAAGIGISNSKNIMIDECYISGNAGTGIGVLKTQLFEQAPCENIGISNSVISNNGMLPGFENENANGIVFASNGDFTVEMPFGYDNVITSCTVTDNAGTGIILTGQNVGEEGDTYGLGTLVSHNSVDRNGLFVGDTFPPANTDGIIVTSSRNVIVERNFIRENIGNGVLVAGLDYPEVLFPQNWAGDNTLTGNYISDNTTAGLTLQVQAYTSSDPKVQANGNWWGHVYGPFNADIPALATGRGELFQPVHGEAVLDTWYGQRDFANRWFALNDQDGDGVWDADEDHSLDTIFQPVPTAPETMIETNAADKDTDLDGFEDGFEVALGTDPAVAGSTPADLGYNIADKDVDADGDGYKDWYEIAQGIAVSDIATTSPKLGDIDNSGAANAVDVIKFRNVLIGNIELTDPGIFQDNMDLDRDGAVTNVDVILIRRKAVNTEVLPFN